MSKYFLNNPNITPLSKEELELIEQDKALILDRNFLKREDAAKKELKNRVTLKHTGENVIIKVDTQFKNQTTLAGGLVIRQERQFNNFNRRETEPVNAYVVSADNIPEGAEILIWHNALHDTNKIFDYKPEGDTSIDVHYYSIPERDCFAWRTENEDFKPMKNFCFGLRVFEPYKGLMQGVEPKQIKDVLYMTTGEFKGKIVHTLKASDYQIVFRDFNGKENSIIRCRHFEGEELNERQEIIAVSDYLTERLFNQELLIGITVSDCKILNNPPNEKSIIKSSKKARASN